MSDLVVQGVVRTFPGQAAPALAGVDLTVSSGSIVAVLGPSGCGKTTLLRAVAGLEPLQAGTITLGGAVLDAPGRHLPPERRWVGLVPQEGVLFPHLDVAGNVAFGLRGQPAAARASRVEEMLALVGLDGLGRRFPDELSGGQQQRVALARALAPGPGVLLLDEPFSSLDANLRSAMRDEVTELLRGAGVTAVVVTHDRAEAMAMADVLAIMRDGVIAQTGSPATLYQQPVDAWAARFLGEAVALPEAVLRFDWGGPQVSSRLGVAPATFGGKPPPPGPVTALVRPEQLLLGDDAGGVEAIVTKVRFAGHDALVGLQVAEHQVLARCAGRGLPVTGQVVRVALAGPAMVFG